MSEPLFTDPRGLVWLDRGPSTDDHLSHGGHERYLIDLAREYKPKEFLDVGAHVGLYTLNLGDIAHVTAIEANPETFKALTANVERNIERMCERPTLVCAAAWDSVTLLKLIDENDKETGGSTRAVNFESPLETLGARVASASPLDRLLGKDYRPDFVKIDVEGAEAHVLRGMRNIVQRARPVFLIEMHDMYWGAKVRTETLAFLDSENYSWNDSLTFSVGYYVLATPAEKLDDWTPEVVHAGEFEAEQ